MKYLDYLIIKNQGKRPFMEDTCYPDSESLDSNIYLVCDGVGGNSGGNIASTIVSKEFATQSIGYISNKNNFKN